MQTVIEQERKSASAKQQLERDKMLHNDPQRSGWGINMPGQPSLLSQQGNSSVALCFPVRVWNGWFDELQH